MATLIDVTAPVGQAEGTESVVSTWLKSIGDEVSQNEPLLEISTDKVNVEVAAPSSGRLAEILKRDGDQVEPGDLLGRIETGAAIGSESGAVSAAPAPSSQADGTEKRDARGSAGGSGELSPAVRRLLREHNLDASQIAGSGRGGRITHQDVMEHVASLQAHAGEASTAAATRTSPARAAKPSGIPGRMVPHTQMRKSIAHHMVESVATAPHVTSVFDADLSSVVEHRVTHRAQFEARGTKLTLTAYFVKAAVEAMSAVPEVNSRWHDDALEIFDDVNIGVATALPSGGLIVPVIARTQELDLYGIAHQLQSLTERARGDKLNPRDVQNGTFTISNHGVSGSLVATPIIINQPQSAILGIGRLERRVVPATRSGDELTTKPMCYVSLTIDHRVLDGLQANQWLTRFTDVLRTFRPED